MSSDSSTPNVQATTPTRPITSNPQVVQVQQVTNLIRPFFRPNIVRVAPAKPVLVDSPSSTTSIKRFNNGDSKNVIQHELTKLPVRTLQVGTEIRVHLCPKCSKLWNSACSQCPDCKQPAQLVQKFVAAPSVQSITCEPQKLATVTKSIVAHSKPLNPLNILTSNSPVNITKKNFYGTRILQPSQAFSRALPSSSVTVVPISITTPIASPKPVTVPKAPTVAKPVIKRPPRAKPEPVCLTISSDEEPEEADSQSSVTSSQEQVEPPTVGVNEMQLCATTSESVNGSSIPMEPETKSINLHCRSIRLGAYKIHNTSDPSALTVNISKESISFSVPTIPDTNSWVLLVNRFEDINSIFICFDRRLHSLYIYTTPGHAGVVRTRLKMIKAEKGYFDPTTDEEFEKRLVILPADITDEQKLFIRELFENSSKLTEIPQSRANELLVRSTPPAEKAYVYTMCPPVTRSTSVVTRQMSEANSSTAAQPAKPEVVKLLTFPPPPETGGITVTSEDLLCLNEGEYLNDVIIDFYLKYLWTEKLSEVDRNRTHIFSSFFFQRLTQKLTRTKASGETMTNQEARHARVKTWTRSIDIFEKDFLIVPVNQQAHWFLVIICFPGLVSEEIRLRNMQGIISNAGGNPGQDANKGATDEILESQDPDMSEENSSDNASDQLTPNPSEAVPKADSTTVPEPQLAPAVSVLKAPQSPKPVPVAAPVVEAKPAPLLIAPPQETGISTEVEANSDPSMTEVEKEPCIIILDSLPGVARWRIVAYLREYLQVEYKVRKGKEILFDRYSMKGLNARVPKQSNFHDCGVYVLQYVESFYKNPLISFRSPLRLLEDWFTVDEINKKRPELKELIFELKKNIQLTAKPSTPKVKT